MVKKATLSIHRAPRLSELDVQMVASIPPGGNWKDIPDSIPSARLQQIRTSYAAGEGSRSTYYGRLRADAPAYTINTYFNRPGNGCFIHYEGGRLVTPREAARLQSFPDSFEFFGSQRQINQQIGNAVPPLLAFQIAQRFGFPGTYVDLFSGAGGLSLGFKWAGWQPIVANDLEPRFLDTYAHNVHENTLVGDISEPAVMGEIESLVRERPMAHPFAFIGGPPCQGFSTAGNKRSMKDKRNHLFMAYAKLLSTCKPDFFVFENVMGLRNIEGGNVLADVIAELSATGYETSVWNLKAEQYGLPQRRHRLFLVGVPTLGYPIEPPKPRTSIAKSATLFAPLPSPPSVQDALSDLPPATNGNGDSASDYRCAPATPYQALMRGALSPQQYLDSLVETCLM